MSIGRGTGETPVLPTYVLLRVVLGRGTGETPVLPRRLCSQDACAPNEAYVQNLDNQQQMKRFFNHDERVEAFRQSDVYPVITTEFCGGRNPLEVAESVLRGGARLLQMREKSMLDGDFLPLLKKARDLTAEYGALLIVDDRVDAALAVDADGVHLGQEDFPLPDARRIVPELLLGVSTHNAEEIQIAQQQGCSYLNIGPIFPTGTKHLACRFLGLDLLRELVPSVHVPFSVMGGIKIGHLRELCAAGASHIAAVTAFTQAEDPAAEVACWRIAMGK